MIWIQNVTELREILDLVMVIAGLDRKEELDRLSDRELLAVIHRVQTRKEETQ